MTDNNEQIMIDTNKYFVEIIDKGGGTVGYNVVQPERLLRDIIKQNKQLTSKTQECEELKSQIDADYECYSQQLKILRNIIENKEKRNARLFVISNNYRKALEEIDKVINNIFDKCLGHKTDGCTPVHNVCEELIKILDIINKAKGEGDD